jgi:hypothetical protein
MQWPSLFFVLLLISCSHQQPRAAVDVQPQPPAIVAKPSQASLVRIMAGRTEQTVASTPPPSFTDLNVQMFFLSGVDAKSSLLNDVQNHPEIWIAQKDKRGFPTGGLVIGSSLKVKGKPRVYYRKAVAILTTEFEFPDRQTVTAFAVDLSRLKGEPKKVNEILEELNNLPTVKARAPNLLIFGGRFNISNADEGRERFFERITQRRWLVAHQIACQACTLPTVDALLFSKDFYDGSGGWKIQPRSIRQTTARGILPSALTLDLAPN